MRPTLVYGAVAGVLSAASMGAMSLVVHVVGAQLPATEIIFCRSLFSLLVLGPFAFRDRRALVSRVAAPLWMLSAFGSISILCFAWNLAHTTIGFANVLFGLAPLGVLMYAWVFRAEEITPTKSVCFLLVVMGSIVFYGDASAGMGGSPVIAVGLVGALAAAMAYATLKRAVTIWSPLTITWATSLASLVLSLLMRRGPWILPDKGLLSALLSIGLLCAVGQILVDLSYRWTPLSTATAIVESSMAFGVLFDVIAGTAAGGRKLLACGVYLAGCIPLMLMKEGVSPAVSNDEPISTRRMHRHH